MIGGFHRDEGGRVGKQFVEFYVHRVLVVGEEVVEGGLGLESDYGGELLFQCFKD